MPRRSCFVYSHLAVSEGSSPLPALIKSFTDFSVASTGSSNFLTWTLPNNSQPLCLFKRTSLPASSILNALVLLNDLSHSLGVIVSSTPLALSSDPTFDNSLPP